MPYTLWSTCCSIHLLCTSMEASAHALKHHKAHTFGQPEARGMLKSKIWPCGGSTTWLSFTSNICISVGPKRLVCMNKATHHCTHLCLFTHVTRSCQDVGNSPRTVGECLQAQRVESSWLHKNNNVSIARKSIQRLSMKGRALAHI